MSFNLMQTREVWDDVFREKPDEGGFLIVFLQSPQDTLVTRRSV